MRKTVKGLFRGKAYNLKEASLALGMSHSALSVLAGDPGKWHFLQMMGKDPVSAVERYRSVQHEIVDKMLEMHRELLETKGFTIISFGEYLCDRGLIRHKRLFSTMLRNLTLNPSKMMGIDTYHRYAMILLCFEGYRKEALHEKRQPLIIVDDLEGKM